MVFIISDLSVTGLVLLFIEGSSRDVLMVGGLSLDQGDICKYVIFLEGGGAVELA